MTNAEIDLLGINPRTGFLAGHKVWVSNVRLEGDWLIADRRIGPETPFPDDWRSKTAGAGILDKFCRLTDAASIRAFAECWGMLGLCEHGLPSSHDSSCVPRGFREGCWRERSDEWLNYVEDAKAVLRYAALLARGRPIIADLPVDGNWFFFSQRVNRWLALSDSRPRIEWEGAHPKFRVGGNDLFSHLALSLALEVCRTDPLATCSGCGIPYSPPRRPNPQRRNYCPDCREEKVPGRDASRDYRRRRLRAQPDIAEGGASV